uniref:BACK domain-containing protein n=1 Tax=Rhizophagus irregularis (strain DAOM 181602 / DAOM 197198 / MUCL 43194) TaxID=747089 RepID=U9UPW0_RHIID
MFWNYLLAVDELNIQQLISHIQGYLVKHQAKFLYQKPTGILETIHQHESFTDLWNFCLETICKEPKILFDSDKFVNLKEPLLELLLKRDDLNMNEIEIWESLLKWSFSQENMENDPTKWNKDDITKVERSLYRFIPLIRFYDIEPTDFFYKVYNYRDVLPKDLIHDLLEFHIVPNTKLKTSITPSRKPNLNFKIDSTLIQSNHIPLFASWIDRKDSSHYNNKNIPYDFKLLYHSGRDGFNAASFHRKYGKNISTAKLGYVNDPDSAIYCVDSQGPQMGVLICQDDNKWVNYDDNATCYPDIGIPNTSDIPNFKVEYYEVFQVLKNKNV